MKPLFNGKVYCSVIMVLLLCFGSAHAFEVTPMAFQYFRSGYVSILDEGSGEFFLSGQTTAKQIVSTISIDLDLQMLVNGSWVDVWSYGKSAYNTSSVSSNHTLYVPRGIYRLRGIHTTKHNGITETSTSYSGIIYY